MYSNQKIHLLNRRYSALVSERSSWIAHWEDISKHILPVSGRFFLTDRNRGDKRHNAIYDSSATRALRILSAGMMSGMTSPSRPWFRLTLSDTDLAKDSAVKAWLSAVEGKVLDTLAKSNCYRVLHQMYEELGAFGTNAALIADDFDNVIHLHPFTAGEFAIATDFKGKVTTMYREFERTVAEIVKEFGIENVSGQVRNMYTQGNLDNWIVIRHAIEPREDRDATKKDSKNMPFKSCYWEASSDGEKKYLRESGYNSFPCVAPRWMTSGGDIYGTSPGMEALGDIKQLQMQQFRKSQAIDYQANPPLQIPISMKNREHEFFPGGISYYDSATNSQGVKTAFEVNLNLQSLLIDIQDIRTRINSSFFADIFMMISQHDARMTATEVAERHEEKMLMLGPVVERLNNELLDPLIETVFEKLLVGGLLPTPPEQMQGADLKIEYISMLSQAQKAISVNSIDRFVSGIGQISSLKPDILDKFDSDYWADIYSDKIGVDPQLIVSGQNVALIRQQRAQAQQAQQQMAMMQQGAEMMSKAGNISTEKGTAAGDALDYMRNRQQ